MTSITNPFPYFPEAGTGGFIYVGAANLDARTNPITVYRDEALTLAWVQPIRTVDGYPAYQGAQAGIYAAADTVSLTVMDAQGAVLINDISVSSANNAANISFIQSGAGAVIRTAQARFRDTVHLTDFASADPSGATSSDAAFTSAIAAGREVYIPAGTYSITPRTFSNLLSLKIQGAGRDVTKIILASTGTALTFSNCQWLQLSDLSIEASGFPQTLANAIGIELNTSSSNCVLERINFYGFSLDGLRMVGTALATLSGNTVRDCYFLGNGRNQVYETYNNDATWQNNQHGRLAGVSLAAFGMLSENCGENIITGCKMWDNTRDLKLLNCAAYRIADCRIEEAQQENLWVENSNDVQIVDNRIHTGSKVGDGVADYVYLLNSARVSIVGNNINTWNATFGRYSVNIDGNCQFLMFRANVLGGFSASFGPIRVSGSTLDISGDRMIHWTATGVGAGATVYPSLGANTAENIAYQSMERRYAVVKMYTATEVAPGAAQSYTYTLRKNGVDTAVTAASAGAASLSAQITTTVPQVIFAVNDTLTTKLVTSAGAAVTAHRGYAVLVAY